MHTRIIYVCEHPKLCTCMCVCVSMHERGEAGRGGGGGGEKGGNSMFVE